MKIDITGLVATIGGRLWLGILLLVLPGCCSQATVSFATRGERHDRVTKIQKAALLPGNTLVIFVEGTAAETFRVQSYTICVSLSRTNGNIILDQDSMTPGWNSSVMDQAGSQPVSVVSTDVHQPRESRPIFHGEDSQSNGEMRTIRMVNRRSSRGETQLCYESDDVPSIKRDIVLASRELRTPARYPLLLLLPFAAGLDAATLPVQLYFLTTVKC